MPKNRDEDLLEIADEVARLRDDLMDLQRSSIIPKKVRARLHKVVSVLSEINSWVEGELD